MDWKLVIIGQHRKLRSEFRFTGFELLGVHPDIVTDLLDLCECPALVTIPLFPFSVNLVRLLTRYGVTN